MKLSLRLFKIPNSARLANFGDRAGLSVLRTSKQPWTLRLINHFLPHPESRFDSPQAFAFANSALCLWIRRIASAIFSISARGPSSMF